MAERESRREESRNDFGAYPSCARNYVHLSLINCTASRIARNSCVLRTWIAIASGKTRNAFHTPGLSVPKRPADRTAAATALVATQCDHSLSPRPLHVTIHARLAATWNLSVTAVNFTVTKARVLPKVASERKWLVARAHDSRFFSVCKAA